MKFFLILIVALISISQASFAQFLSGKNSQVLVKGTVKDENTSEPLGVDIEIRSLDGKKIKTQSNIITGVFEQLLPSGESYIVILNSDDILRKEFEFSTEKTDSYKEQEAEWTAIKPLPGSKIFSGEIFSNGNDEITSDGQKKLKEIQMLLRFNRSLYVNFEISGESSLAQKRITTLNNVIGNWTREKSRIELVTNNSNTSAKDIIVKVNKIEEFIKK